MLEFNYWSNRLSDIIMISGLGIQNDYTYDNQNRLKTVSNGGSLIATYNYTINGARSSLVYANGTSAYYSYNLANWLTRLENRSNNTMVSSYDYTYFADGNQRTKTDHTGRVTTYAYDAASRLASESENTGFGAAYTYDRFGNRATMSVTGAENYTVAYSYDANNRLTQDVKTAGSTVTTGNYFYDPNGNQLVRVKETLTPTGSGTPQIGSDPSGVELYEYDGRNRLVWSSLDGEEISYTYRADGLRNSKETAAGKTMHVWDGASMAAEILNADDSNNATAHYYVWGIGLLIARGRYYLYNGHSDVVQLADSSGNIIKAYDYDAYGVERNPDPDDTNPFRYCGEYYDSETNAYYLRARNYSPITGRFFTEDPIRDGVNWYTYCSNKPTFFIDPWGLDPIAIRTFTERFNGIVSWDADTRMSTFSLFEKTLTTFATGANYHGLTITNVDGRMMAEETELYIFFNLKPQTVSVDGGSFSAQVTNTYITKYVDTVAFHTLVNVSGSVTIKDGFRCSDISVGLGHFGYNPQGILLRGYDDSYSLKGSSFCINTHVGPVDAAVGAIVNFQFQRGYVSGGVINEIVIYNYRAPLETRINTNKMIKMRLIT